MDKSIAPLPTSGLLLIKNRKLLLAFSNNKQCFYLPGGKIDEGESAVVALCREIGEELNLYLQEQDLEYYTHVSAPAYGEKNGVIMEQDCFIHTKEDEDEPMPSSEIGELKYFSVDDYSRQEHQAPGVVIILELLQSDDLID
jgi:8-oxo-dGTP pyrophosphatase MutT (NUDIX family)